MNERYGEVSVNRLNSSWKLGRDDLTVSHEPYIWDQAEEPFGPLKKLAERFGDVVVPIFQKSTKRASGMDGAGSGFLLRHRDQLFLVTARHVIEQVKQIGTVMGNFGGEAAYLDEFRFATSINSDLAISHLSHRWISEKLPHTRVRPLRSAPTRNADDGRQDIRELLAMGYPGTKNRLDARRGKVDRSLYSITVLRSARADIETEVVNPIFLDYDHKVVLSDRGERLGNQPDLQGMSGGPLFQVTTTTGSLGEVRFGVVCVGVLSEWKRAERIIVATPIEAVIDLIETGWNWVAVSQDQGTGR